MPERFETRLGVRVFDTDAQGHLTGAAYVQYANHALWECVRAAGVDVDALLASGIGPVNLETRIRFLRELRGGDEVDVSCRLAFGDGKTYQVNHEFRTIAGELAADVSSVFGLLDLAHRRLVRTPARDGCNSPITPSCSASTDRVRPAHVRTRTQALR